MTDEIKVHVVTRKGLNLYLRYTDPVTGKRYERNSGTKSQRKAQRAAGEWQAELNASGTVVSKVILWEDFKDDFEQNYLAPLSTGYQQNVGNTLSVIDQMMGPDKLTRINANWLKRFRAVVQEGRSAATVHKYFQHLGTMLRWAVDQGYIRELPKFPKQKKNAGKSRRKMKGRAVTTEEFERMLAKCETESLKYLMRGLWLSGLRLGEALALTWDQWADGIRIEVDGSDVFLLIDSDDQKNRETQTYPVVDDFAEFLLRTPQSERAGFVFNPCRKSGKVSRRVDTVSDWIVDTGTKANVKVDQKPDTDEQGNDIMRPVFASAHDLRRAFGERWALIVPSMLLKDLMRHASVATTEQFYVGINARKSMEAIRQYRQAVETQSKKVNSEVNEGSESAT